MKKNRSTLVFILIVAIVFSACALPLPGLVQPEGEEGEAEGAQAVEEGEEAAEASYNVNSTQAKLSEFLLRPEDLPDDYRIPSGGEKRWSNKGLINEIGEVEAKEYIVATGRVEGWRIELERVNKEDIAPARFESTVELFETNEGARLALTPEWFKAYQEDYAESTWIEDGCDIGDDCIFYFHEKYDPAAELTTVTYEVAFVHQNVLVWVLGRGLDIDMSQEYVLDAARSVYDRISKVE
jgi:hypothetical protein